MQSSVILGHLYPVRKIPANVVICECNGAAPNSSSNAALNFDYCSTCKKVTSFRRTSNDPSTTTTTAAASGAPPSSDGHQGQLTLKRRKPDETGIGPVGAVVSEEYRNIASNIGLLAKKPHAAAEWVKAFFWLTSQRPARNTREMRVLIKVQTKQACKDKGYFVHSGIVPSASASTNNSSQVEAEAESKRDVSNRRVSLDAHQMERSILNTILYEEKALVKWYHQARTANDKAAASVGLCVVSVCNMDCLDAAAALVREGHKTAVLNMASSTSPGGGWEYGAGAQEENLHRRSTYGLALSDPLGMCRQKGQPRTWRYPLPEFGGVYTVSRIWVVLICELHLCGFLTLCTHVSRAA
jgi:hypothetical protein